MLNPLGLIDNFLNRITMYRLVLYFLILLMMVAFVLSLFGLMPFGWFELVLSTAVLVSSCLLANRFFSKIFKIPANVESAYITALILALIITHTSDEGGLAFLVLASIIAMASKYLLVFRGKHLFNPAAIAVLITFYAIGEGASWWIGGVYILPVVIIGGFLVIRKIQRFDLVLSFLFFYLATLALDNKASDFGVVLQATFINSSLLFFTCVMLTEPLTTPPKRNLRIAYGAIAGLLYGTNFFWGNIISSPELALVLGNLFSFVVSSKGRYRLFLKSKSEIAEGVYSFVFEPNRKLEFTPGQYMEWTVDPKNSDNRGNRRFFTIASSPTEPKVELSAKFYNNPSTFKQKLQALNPGDKLFAGQIAGEFVLPKDAGKKLVFIAGGIGITPFRSIIKYLVDKNKKRDIVLLYSVKISSEIAYKDLFSEAERKLGLKVVFIETDKSGYLNQEMIKSEISDFSDRAFMISGPRNMVTAFENILKSMGVPSSQIKVDFFPGYV